MNKITKILIRIPSAIWRRLLSRPLKLLMYLFYGIQFGRNPIFVGYPVFRGDGKIVIGDDCVLVSNKLGNPVGLFRPCIIGTLDNLDGNFGTVSIGDRFSASGVVIWAQTNVSIGNDVMIGANVTIADTDFHSTDLSFRKNGHKAASTKKIVIEDHVWIGMNAVILKGVTIGRGAIIGANCVVSKDVPPNKTVVSAATRLI